ncbi:hypothetical protein ACWGIB_08755 [Streptomyces xiamenensis]
MMKLRRAAAAAAVTAVMAPAALLAASPAFAADGDPSGAPEVIQDAPTPEPQAGDDADESAQDDIGTDGTGSAGEGITDGGTGGETVPDPEDDNSDNDEGEDEGDTGEGSDGGSGDGSDEGEDEEEDKESGGDNDGEPVLPDPDEQCAGWEFDVTAVNTELIGLPGQVVAGQWTEFTYRISNEFDQPVETLYAFAEVYAWDNDTFNDIAIDLQWFVDGAWESITDEYGYFGATDRLAPGEYAEAQLRLKVADDAPAGVGYALSTGIYVDADGLCQEGEFDVHYFDIVPAGTTPDDKPSTGTKEQGNKPAPQGEFEQLPVTGELAATGSSPALPMFALAGATAVGLGAGAMFLVRRRTGAGIA